MFTCYGFGLILKEQFRDPKAGELSRAILMDYGKSFCKKWLNHAIEKGMVKPFDADTIANLFVNSVLTCITLKVQESIVPNFHYDIAAEFDGLRRLIMDVVEIV